MPVHHPHARCQPTSRGVNRSCVGCVGRKAADHPASAVPAVLPKSVDRGSLSAAADPPRVKPEPARSGWWATSRTGAVPERTEHADLLHKVDLHRAVRWAGDRVGLGCPPGSGSNPPQPHVPGRPRAARQVEHQRDTVRAIPITLRCTTRQADTPCPDCTPPDCSARPEHSNHPHKQHKQHKSRLTPETNRAPPRRPLPGNEARVRVRVRSVYAHQADTRRGGHGRGRGRGRGHGRGAALTGAGACGRGHERGAALTGAGACGRGHERGGHERGGALTGEGALGRAAPRPAYARPCGPAGHGRPGPRRARTAGPETGTDGQAPGHRRWVGRALGWGRAVGAGASGRGRVGRPWLQRWWGPTCCGWGPGRFRGRGFGARLGLRGR
ncbi:hypothetical protein JOF29_007709 [Kribbella aluminosa]|uniref:Uncharacterized protein n=1 Tax=Kribbella aluminosa TaxID=416017 RepID=A0ABS4UY90_9ACTN|nr:hypothetical protein [Kribbella aluminosa]